MADRSHVPPRPKIIDMDSHTGLRGVAAVWVMVFHMFEYSKFEFDLQGSTLMPVFFLMSGFTLTAVYSKKPYRLTTLCGSACKDPSQYQEQDLEKFDAAKYYRNRFARTMPLYYATFLFGLGLWFGGYSIVNSNSTDNFYHNKWGVFIGSLVVNIIPINTLPSFILGLPFNNPSWTVCTLIFFWAWFPYYLPRVQRMTDDELRQGIVKMFYVQLFVLCLVFGFMAIAVPILAFVTATMNPISRFPVFLMGMYAGALCDRSKDKPLVWVSTTMFRVLPKCMQSCCCVRDAENNRVGCCGSADTTGGTESTGASESTAVFPDGDRAKWKRITTQQSLSLLVVTLAVFGIDLCCRRLGLVTNDGIWGRTWLQAFVPFMQLEVIVGLTREGATAPASRFLRSKLWTWLGKLSMSIYLVHFPVMYYACWAINGKIEYPEITNCDGKFESHTSQHDECVRIVKAFNEARIMPMWVVPIAMAVAMVLSVLFYYGVEEPSRRWLRG